MTEAYARALKLLRRRDYTVSELREKLGDAPEEVIQLLLQKNYLNDRRYAENYVARRKTKGAVVLRQELETRGVPAQLIEETLLQNEWPSLQAALKATMSDWNLRPPLQRRDASRLFRALLRLGYEEDAIREEIEQLHEQ
jgi:regulatory protein